MGRAPAWRGAPLWRLEHASRVNGVKWHEDWGSTETPLEGPHGGRELVLWVYTHTLFACPPASCHLDIVTTALDSTASKKHSHFNGELQNGELQNGGSAWSSMVAPFLPPSLWVGPTGGSRKGSTWLTQSPN